MGPFFRQVENRQGRVFWCPGCECTHYVNDSWPQAGPDTAPTLRPSVLRFDDTKRCHLFITDGEIQFLKDCSHKLANQFVPMVPIEGKV